jgi:hypothetical protein
MEKEIDSKSKNYEFSEVEFEFMNDYMKKIKILKQIYQPDIDFSNFSRYFPTFFTLEADLEKRNSDYLCFRSKLILIHTNLIQLDVMAKIRIAVARISNSKSW